jgi:predicted RNA binding protein YcfA (HicA-like mRNA interferase family)
LWRERLAFCKGISRPSRLITIGWTVQRQTGSHRTLSKDGWPNYVFAFHESDEIGPRMLARIAKHTGLRPDDL